MSMRILNLLIIGALVLAASYVYKIKFESTQRVERAATLRSEIRREQDAIAMLRAKLAQLEAPGRIQALAQRHLPLEPVTPQQLRSFDHLPERPSEAAGALPDRIGDLIDEAIGSVAVTSPMGTR
jgi:hypothetical protein